jgi:hypothetical protein
VWAGLVYLTIAGSAVAFIGWVKLQSDSDQRRSAGGGVEKCAAKKRSYRTIKEKDDSYAVEI